MNRDYKDRNSQGSSGGDRDRERRDRERRTFSNFTPEEKPSMPQRETGRPTGKGGPAQSPPVSAPPQNNQSHHGVQAGLQSGGLMQTQPGMQSPGGPMLSQGQELKPHMNPGQPMGQAMAQNMAQNIAAAGQFMAPGQAGVTGQTQAAAPLSKEERMNAWELGVQVSMVQARSIREIHEMVETNSNSLDEFKVEVGNLFKQLANEIKSLRTQLEEETSRRKAAEAKAGGGGEENPHAAAWEAYYAHQAAQGTGTGQAGSTPTPNADQQQQFGQHQQQQQQTSQAPGPGGTGPVGGQMGMQGMGANMMNPQMMAQRMQQNMQGANNMGQTNPQMMNQPNMMMNGQPGNFGNMNQMMNQMQNQMQMPWQNFPNQGMQGGQGGMGVGVPPAGQRGGPPMGGPVGPGGQKRPLQ